MAYNLIKVTKGLETLIKGITFLDYLKLIDSDVPLRFTGHEADFAPYPRWQMIDWLGIGTEITANLVLKNETMDSVFSSVTHFVGKKICHHPSSRPHVTKHGDWKTYYTEESAEIVRRRHKDDFRIFGYSTEL